MNCFHGSARKHLGEEAGRVGYLGSVCFEKNGMNLEWALRFFFDDLHGPRNPTLPVLGPATAGLGLAIPLQVKTASTQNQLAST